MLDCYISEVASHSGPETPNKNIPGDHSDNIWQALDNLTVYTHLPNQERCFFYINTRDVCKINSISLYISRPVSQIICQ